ncbi:protein ALTERED PHOSPHATE STARVATION RESPONSE 1 [Phoenix dactylifera]|uniref:Protein ALTERED PHOSPHATE STARVATION RESPONSE 1 n=1 Tax=Phoenix dactylifera TaxID=42345 RepID=A0A8B7D3U3_PHODC|nr:protein ALTERED PHOSPHATE STARVATION RESPONSE 1 [Phoenix dactylifera]
MGCVHSRVEKDEAAQRCRERKRLMKLLLSRRADLAAAHMSYLQSLRNTGATLRQFTEVESMVPVNALPSLTLPPSPPPPPPLPPSPPPPPHFSSITKEGEEEGTEEDSIDIDDNGSCPAPPPLVHSSAWDFWDPFGLPTCSNSPSPVLQRKDGREVVQTAVEEEDWAETNTEFGDDAEEEEKVEGKENALVVGQNVVLNPIKENSPVREFTDDNSSAVSWYTKDTDMALVVWRSKKTLAGIVKELDDYFLKAAAGGRDVAVLLEPNHGQRHPCDFEGKKGKSLKSAKVFNALSWSWSSRPPQSNRGAYVQEASDACRPQNHCMTLEKLYAEEQKLYKAVKEDEIAKFLHKKKTLLLHKLEDGDHDWLKTEKTRSNIEELQCRIISLQESINGTCMSISKLRDEELHPQLVELSSGLVQMWRMMYECHQVQNHVAQQVNLLDHHPGTEPTTDSHRHATAQLETEVTSWYSSFCNLLKSQREYISIINQWVRLTDCLPDSNGIIGSASGIHGLCEELQCAFDRLPDKVAAEAIKSFVSVVHSIVLQQNEECNLQKKSVRLESRLEKELNSLWESEKHNEHTIENPVQVTDSDHHPLSTKHGKLEAFKKRVEEEKAKYMNSVRMSRAMTLNNLQTSLPNVFQALMGFSSVCVQAFEGINRSSESATSHSENI